MTLGSQARPREATVATCENGRPAYRYGDKVWMTDDWVHLIDRQTSIPAHRIISVVWR